MESLIELLSDSQKASIIIYNIASYIIYIYPGIISIYSYNFFNAKTTHTSQAFIFKSFAISYLYNMFLGELCQSLNIAINGILYNLILIAISFAIPYGLHYLKGSKLFASICKFFNINTSITDVPFELLEDSDEEYTCLKIYLKDTPYVYIGYVSEYQYESENDKYVILSGYKKYKLNNNQKEKLLIDNNSDDYHEKVYINLTDIKVIEKISEKRASTELYK